MWEQIRANRRRSLFLVAGIAALLAAMGWAGGELVIGPGHGPFGVPVGLAILGVQLLIYRFAAEPLLLHGTNARQLEREDCPRLFNIVEEMMLASGLRTMPRIFLIDDEAPNAFAMGRRPDNSAVAVTTGLLHRLNRDELQGVIAHELAHINNRDVQFMTLAGVMIGSMVILSDWIWHSMRGGSRGRSRSSSRDSGGGGGHIVLVLIAVTVVVLAPILARLLYYATSRRREYLADACGAQYTRYPEGLASALEKISTSGLSLASTNRAVAAMCIVNPEYAALAVEPASAFSTHPPTRERIRILRSMSGAGLNAYEAAFTSVKGEGIIGARSLAGAPDLPVREGAGEGPIETRHDSRHTALRRSGYVDIQCPTCTARMSIAPTFLENEIICIRCGTKVPIPTAGEAMKPAAAVAAEPRAFAPRPDTPPVPNTPLHYERTGTGWENFRCPCGSTVQLSPSFQAPHTTCPRCHRRITIGG